MTGDSRASPTVSVIIPTFNQAASGYLKEAIESVLASTYRDFELIVVDDGSTDETPRLVAGYDAVRYHRRENGGTAAARNTGLGLARGKYIALLDDDDLYLPHRLEKQVPILEEDPGLALVYGQTVTFDTRSGEESVWPAGDDAADGLIFERLFFHCMIPALTVLVRRSVIDEVGGFNESLRGTDDWELWLRISARHPVRCIGEPLARFRWHAGNTSRNVTRMLENETAALESIRRIHPELVKDLGPRASRFLGEKHVRAGRGLQKEGRLVDAHRHYTSAMRLGLRSPKLLVNWLLTF